MATRTSLTFAFLYSYFLVFCTFLSNTINVVNKKDCRPIRRTRAKAAVRLASVFISVYRYIFKGLCD